MQSETERREEVIIYRPLEPVLNASHTVQLKSDFAVLAHTSEAKPVVVDMSQVRALDSSVLSALLMLRRLLEGQGRSLVVVSDQEAVKSVFRLSKMDMVMPLLPTIEEALAFFGQQVEMLPKKVEDEPEEEDIEEIEEEEEEWDEEDWEDEDWEDEDWEDEEDWDDDEEDWEDEDWEDEDWEDEEEEDEEEED